MNVYAQFCIVLCCVFSVLSVILSIGLWRISKRVKDIFEAEQLHKEQIKSLDEAVDSIRNSVSSLDRILETHWRKTTENSDVIGNLFEMYYATSDELSAIRNTARTINKEIDSVEKALQMLRKEVTDLRENQTNSEDFEVEKEGSDGEKK